jgi:hypothetical protein
MFNESRTNVHDEERSGRPSLVTEILKNRINQHIRTNRRFTLDEIHVKFFKLLVRSFMKLLRSVSVKDWFNGLGADFYEAGIQKLVTGCDKCLNLYGDYVEK